jgi:hypothetical protein
MNVQSNIGLLQEKSTLEQRTNVFLLFCYLLFFLISSLFFQVFTRGILRTWFLPFLDGNVLAAWFSLEEDFVHCVWSSSLGLDPCFVGPFFWSASFYSASFCTIVLLLVFITLLPSVLLHDSCFRKLSFENWVDALVLAYLHHLDSMAATILLYHLNFCLPVVPTS